MVDLKNLLDDASRQDGRAVDALDVVHAGRRRVRRRGVVRAGAALALVLVVSATALTVRPWESEEPRLLEPVSPPAPKVSPVAPKDSEFTSPGSLLDIGETARVPVEHADRRGKVELTVTAVRRGDTADLLADPEISADLRQRLETGQIWYVDVTIRYLSGKIGGYYLDSDVEPVLRGGGGHNQVSYLFDFAPCPSLGLSSPPVPGESVKDCVVFRTPPGTDVVGLRWGPFETPYFVGTEKPVVWR
ncbi:hypothetical protein [Nocardioides jishulii]|uniref:Uncharacterized protein n=1 Tax=Nocardioides jishulii TaxID=2575440 RepID=A0A4U2YRW5_9ACTN|nr:hypothetical protein [Nocardioides jishulii]QCX28951.1 hypothetical protein FCL41_16570 [Nocardioides jishulii]TKI64148.1 hypothetical protein FC770_02995 [Nocardioides jishulii]